MSQPVLQSVVDPTNPYGLPLTTSNVNEEYQAACERAISVSRNARGRMRLAGDRAREVLTGLVTNDIVGLAPGQGAYAVALTAKGKIVADLRTYARGSELWLDASPLAWPGWWLTVRKYINPRLAKYEDLTEGYRTTSVYGGDAVALVSRALGLRDVELAELAEYGHRPIGDEDRAGLVARVSDTSLPGFDIWVPTDRSDWLRERLQAAGVQPGGAMVADILRIEAGRPEWGLDMDDNSLAQEANMDALHAISYTKGCYTGQETVARVHFRGHVNRHLRGLRLTAGEFPRRGSDVLSAQGSVVGDLRSSAKSPRHGFIALAMLRREVNPGDRVLLSADGSNAAEVVDLPFS
ncbi:MAG: glycine cleavage T C-terminal barrel domain-containing protein [Gemmatimonadaceae bacterium]